MAGYSNPSGLDRMLELHVAALLPHLVPTVAFDHFQHVANLHARASLRNNYTVETMEGAQLEHGAWSQTDARPCGARAVRGAEWLAGKPGAWEFREIFDQL
jgi:hypothetical protein